LLDKLN